MHFRSCSISATGFIALLSVQSTVARLTPVPRDPIDTYTAVQSPISKQGILDNIGPSGLKAHGAKSGVVIASPSTSNPNYLYTWIRDSSLVYKLLIDQYTQGTDKSLQPGIDRWVASQSRIQQVTNPSGTVMTGGLGEPKFNIDESAFTDPWGRPQRDGPALRAISMITYGNYLREGGDPSKKVSPLWSAIKLDLDYVQGNWHQLAFDLWEEVKGNSFFTHAAQHRALRQGAAFALATGDDQRHTSYTNQAQGVLCYMKNYWSASNSYIVANLDSNDGRSGLDANTILGSIHSFDPDAACDRATFQPCSDIALANHYAVVNSFRSLYTINANIPANRGVALGRYQEDVYYSGNPWYLTTFAAAEQLYDALYTWNKLSGVQVTDTSLTFFKQFLPTAVQGTYNPSSPEYRAIVAGVKQMADDFLRINERYTPKNGGLAEQYDKATGVPTSAADLTWSYASSLTAFARRDGVVPASWGASGLSC